MNEEEKEALETLDDLRVYNLNKFISDKEAKAIMTTLKLINKQQKEIEELEAMIDLKSYGVFRTQKENFRKRIKEEYISKDKIKDLKQLVHKTLDDNGITRGYQLTIDNYFKELLEE